VNAPPAKTVALIDFLWVGHHPSFFRLYCAALLERGLRVVAFCPRPEEVRQWEPEACRTGRLEAQEFTDEVHLHRWKRKVRQLAVRHRFQQSARRLAAWEAQAGQPIGLAFFACLYDGVSPLGGADAVFPYRWTAMLLDSGSVRLPAGPRRWWRDRSFHPLAIFRARNCVSLATLDEFIRDALERRTGKPVFALPDTVDDRPPLRADLPLAGAIRERAGARAIIGSFGQFARRKGALNFLRLAQACRDEPWFFVWVGELEQGTFSSAEWNWLNEFLASRPANCLVEFGRVAEEADFNALVALSQVIYLCYRGHPGSSNMVGKAAALDKLVLVSDGYCMADQVRSYDLGFCVPEDDLPAAKTALRRLLDPQESLPTPRFSDYRADHSPARFFEVVAAMAAGGGA
jgi:hypothetical protein